MAVTVRATVVRDTAAIDLLVQETVKAEANSTQLLETALLCLTAFDEKDAVVGYLCLDDQPCVRLGDSAEAGAAWTAEAAGPRMVMCSTAFVRACVVAHLYEIEAAGALLKAAFSMIPSLQSLLLVTSHNISFTEPGLAGVFARAAVSKDGSGFALYEGRRSAVLPPLAIRPARVEDHDDMLPILERCESAFPALAKLPESSRPNEPFALTRVVAGQDEQNRVLVAEADGRLIGFVVITSEVDTDSLAETFDLHPYDNFLPADVYEEQYAAAREAVRSQKVSLLEADAVRRAEDTAARKALEAELAAEAAKEAATQAGPEGGDGGEGEATVAEGGEDAPAVDGEGAGAAEDGDAGAGTGSEAVDAEAEAMAAAATPTEEEIRAEMLAMFAGRPANVESTMFAITMLCVEPGYEVQVSEFLEQAFAAFPDKLYCVATLPHESREPALMDVMTRVAPLPGSLYPEVLFMFNRHALTPGFTVRLGAPEDLEQVAALTDGMPNAAEICESFAGAADAGTAVVAVCGGEVVGLVTVNPEVDLELLQANFGLSSHVDLAHLPRPQHGEVDMYTMNPIFVHRHRDLLASAMRLLGKCVLYYALPPGQQPPDMMNVLDQAAPRMRVNDKLQADFALYLFTRRGAFRRRRGINAQVVVAGASECGLAVLERLLLNPELQFNYLTLLAPGGIKVGGMACLYTATVIAKLGLEARVLLLDAELVAVDRSQRLVDLSDGTQLAYDALVIAAGVQDQSRYHFAEQDPNIAGLLVTELELAADFTMNDAMVMGSIMVAGDSLGAYHALSVLEAKGASDKTRFVASLPPAGGRRPRDVELLHGVAEAACVALPQPERLDIARAALLPVAGSEPHAIVTLVDPANPGPREEVPVDLLVGCAPPSVSRALFTCLNDASLVFDGRVVVDDGFRTNDPAIYAGGTLARLSRRHGGMHLETYNSRDVGQHLADSLASRFMAATDGDGAASTSAPAPAPLALHQARVIGCGLPGGLNFLYAGTPTALQTLAPGAPEGGMSMSTRTERGYMQVNLDADGAVCSIAYLGRVAVPAARLSALVGLHGNYLHMLAAKYQSGEVPDLLTFLMAPWSELLYHDGFGGFREQLLELAQGSVVAGGRDVEGGLVEMVTGMQDAVLEYVRARASELPGYQVPAAARVGA